MTAPEAVPPHVYAAITSATDRRTPMDHDPRDGVTERRRVTDPEREALDLLGQPTTAAWVRHSLSEWGRVDRLAGVLADARTRPAVPAPRPPAEWRGIDVRGGVTR